LPIADARQQYTEWCKNCLDESDFHMVGGGKFVVKVCPTARDVLLCGALLTLARRARCRNVMYVL
jgi:hypothetical protein